MEGVKKTQTLAKQIVLSNQLNKLNSFDKPFEVAPVEADIAVKNKKLNLQLKPYSFTVIKVKM